MEQAHYILRTNAANLVPKDPNKGKKWFRIYKKTVYIILLLMVLISLICWENMFAEFGWTTQVMLICAVIYTRNPKKDVPMPLELHFYNDRLVIHYPKFYYNDDFTKYEIVSMPYDKITKCVFRTDVQRIHIYGDCHTTWWRYDKNGNLPEAPEKDYLNEKYYEMFSTKCAPDVDFVKEIETHSPIKVMIED